MYYLYIRFRFMYI